MTKSEVNITSFQNFSVDGSAEAQSHAAPDPPSCRYCIHGPRHRDVVEELVRREAERCDRLAGFVAMMSVAGGTGSGVGTYVTQCLRDVQPKSFVLNHLVWPYGTGEVPAQ